MAEIKQGFSYCLDDKFTLEEIEQRKIFLNCEVDECVIESAVYSILRYNQIDKGIPKEERKPILLYINSPGGSVIDGYGLVDAIESSVTPVYTINQAQCSSMAFLIFITGHKRFTMKHSTFLMHDGSNFAYGSTTKVQDRMKFEAEQVEPMTKEHVCKHTKISSEKYDDMLRVEWYFLPKEAKEIGVTDFIVGEDCTIEDIV